MAGRIENSYSIYTIIIIIVVVPIPKCYGIVVLQTDTFLIMEVAEFLFFKFFFLQLMKEVAKATTPPPYQKMERKESLEQEHRSALERADTLNIPHVVPPSQESLDAAGTSSGTAAAESQTEMTPTSKSSGRTNWDELVEKLFIRSDSGRSLVLKKDIIIE